MFSFYLQIRVSSPQKQGSHILGIIMQHFAPIYVAIIFVGAILIQSEAKRKYNTFRFRTREHETLAFCSQTNSDL